MAKKKVEKKAEKPKDKLPKSLDELFQEQAADQGINKGSPRYLTARQFFAFGVRCGKAQKSTAKKTSSVKTGKTNKKKEK